LVGETHLTPNENSFRRDPSSGKSQSAKCSWLPVNTSDSLNGTNGIQYPFRCDENG
jgi:hypothetical protein